MTMNFKLVNLTNNKLWMSPRVLISEQMRVTFNNISDQEQAAVLCCNMLSANDT